MIAIVAMNSCAVSSPGPRDGRLKSPIPQEAGKPLPDPSPGPRTQVGMQLHCREEDKSTAIPTDQHHKEGFISDDACGKAPGSHKKFTNNNRHTFIPPLVSWLIPHLKSRKPISERGTPFSVPSQVLIMQVKLALSSRIKLQMRWALLQDDLALSSSSWRPHI